MRGGRVYHHAWGAHLVDASNDYATPNSLKYCTTSNCKDTLDCLLRNMHCELALALCRVRVAERTRIGFDLVTAATCCGEASTCTGHDNVDLPRTRLSRSQLGRGRGDSAHPHAETRGRPSHHHRARRLLHGQPPPQPRPRGRRVPGEHPAAVPERALRPSGPRRALRRGWSRRCRHPRGEGVCAGAHECARVWELSERVCGLSERVSEQASKRVSE